MSFAAPARRSVTSRSRSVIRRGRSAPATATGQQGNVSGSGLVAYTTGSTGCASWVWGRRLQGGRGAFAITGETILMEAIGGGQSSQMIAPAIANGGTYTNVKNNGFQNFDPYTIGPATFVLDLSGITASTTTVTAATFSFGHRAWTLSWRARRRRRRRRRRFPSPQASRCSALRWQVSGTPPAAASDNLRLCRLLDGVTPPAHRAASFWRQSVPRDRCKTRPSGKVGVPFAPGHNFALPYQDTAETGCSGESS